MYNLCGRRRALREKTACIGCFLWDLTNFYEFISRPKLWERARARGFNEAIVSIALNQYGSRRFLGLGELAMDAGYPERGIAAGCGWATTWVQVYTLDPLLVWQESSPQVNATLFMDDFMGAATAQEEHQVVGWLANGAAALWTVIEHDLECKVAAHKSVLLASSIDCFRSSASPSAGSAATRRSQLQIWGSISSQAEDALAGQVLAP